MSCPLRDLITAVLDHLLGREPVCPDCDGTGRLGGDGPWCGRCLATERHKEAGR